MDGDVYDSASTYFMLSKTTRESLKYDGDYYWEYTNAYVNGVKQSVYVDQDLALEVGHLYKATKTVDEKYITGIEDVELKDNNRQRPRRRRLLADHRGGCQGEV